MKHLKIYAVPMLAMGLLATACSSDDHESNLPLTGNQIQYSVAAPIAPRVVSRPETTTASIETFLVNAFSEGTRFINNVTVNKNGGKWTPAEVSYWPAAPVNFYAISPDIRTNVTNNNGSMTFVYDNPGNQDLLYSVAADQTQSSTTAPKPVELNFRHALSRIVVLMSSAKSDMEVFVKEVELENILQRGEFTYPSETTAIGGSLVGTWGKQTENGDADVFESKKPDGTPNPDGQLLTSTATEFSNCGFSFAIPQDLKVAGDVNNEVTGSYIKVEAVIKNKAGLVIWPNAQTPAANRDGDKGIIRFPLCRDNAAMPWIAGQAYIYNIAINNLPGLELIDFTVTVDQINYDKNVIDIEQ